MRFIVTCLKNLFSKLPIELSLSRTFFQFFYYGREVLFLNGVGRSYFYNGSQTFFFRQKSFSRLFFARFFYGHPDDGNKFYFLKYKL